ncbi:polysaccharide lyase, partial [Salegentibacter salegens]
GETTARSPSNAIITGNDRIRWMIRWDSTRIKQDNNSEGLHYIDLGKIPKNKWIDWVVHIKYSHTNTGILEVWMDDVKVIDRQNMPNSYNDEKYPYFKFGVYKWKWGTAATQRVIYYDEVRIGDKNSSYDEVKPGY